VAGSLTAEPFAIARTATWKVWVADWDQALGEIDSYEHLTLVARYNATSTYELVLPTDTEEAQLLLAAARPRLLIYANGQVYRSGPVVRIQRDRAPDGDMLTVNGVDDMVWLERRVAHPQPGTAAPPYSTTAYDVRTGSASQVISQFVNVNAGPGAIPARQVPGLTVPTPAAFGGTITASARYQQLLAFLQPILTQQRLGLRIRNLAAEVFQPTGAAVFSVEMGTLASWTSALDAPDLTYVYVGGQGDGTARTIREVANAQAVIDWGRVEAFQDRRDTNVAAELDQAGLETLAEGIHPTMLQLEALNTDGQQFLRDWNVGDLATAAVGGLTITDVITEAQIDLQPNEPPNVIPTIGGNPLTLAQWRLAQQQSRRLRQLERT
jgi:hypothetical protein